jgi:hypothetical protein
MANSYTMGGKSRHGENRAAAYIHPLPVYNGEKKLATQASNCRYHSNRSSSRAFRLNRNQVPDLGPTERTSKWLMI